VPDRDEEAMMARTVAHAVVQRLAEWGVCRLFGYSGDGINTLFGSAVRSTISHPSPRRAQAPPAQLPRAGGFHAGRWMPTWRG
jgi:hypothetical protein